MIAFDTSEQGSEAWRRERAGFATASRFADILGSPTARDSYLQELVSDRLTGEPGPDITARSLAWGKGNEAFARADYCIQTGEVVHEVGFAHHPSIAWVGASSDGLVGERGGLEIKSPHDRKVQHITWRTGMPKEHRPQVQGNMWVLDLDWIDFVSFDPRYKKDARLYIERIPRDEIYIAKMETAIKLFLAQVNLLTQDTLERINARKR